MKKHLLTTFLFITFLLSSCVSTQGEKEHKAISFVDIQDTSNHVTTIISYPVFSNETLLNSEIENYIGERWNNIKNNSSLVYEQEHKESEFIVESSVTQSGAIISVLLNIYQYSGGANGETILKSFNYDTKKNTFIDITSASGYSLEELASLSKEYLLSSFRQGLSPDLPEEYIQETEDMIIKGIKPTSEVFSTFTLDNSLLTIYFDEGTVASYSEGIKKVSLSINN